MAGDGEVVDVVVDVVEVVDAGGCDVPVGAEVVEAGAAGSDVSPGTEEAVVEVVEVVEAGAVVGVVEVEAVVGVAVVVSVPSAAGAAVLADAVIVVSGAEAAVVAAVGSGSLSPLSPDEHAAATSTATAIAAPAAKNFAFIAQKPLMRTYTNIF